MDGTEVEHQPLGHPQSWLGMGCHRGHPQTRHPWVMGSPGPPHSKVPYPTVGFPWGCCIPWRWQRPGEGSPVPIVTGVPKGWHPSG